MEKKVSILIEGTQKRNVKSNIPAVKRAANPPAIGKRPMWVINSIRSAGEGSANEKELSGSG
ncbi:MAG: hypothetical protein GDA51_10080 [Ekhidna sp.]|nr:hypothetical protein [Ekhidna sp.]MBC6410691.1 hypothetical protein [Ekhidna sp.]MBC6426793.1 hypothetical protein [Ekhidna sp.]